MLLQARGHTSHYNSNNKGNNTRKFYTVSDLHRDLRMLKSTDQLFKNLSGQTVFVSTKLQKKWKGNGKSISEDCLYIVD
jgi:hypothetical protein